jgi:hypothetical protein
MGELGAAADELGGVVGEVDAPVLCAGVAVDVFGAAGLGAPQAVMKRARIMTSPAIRANVVFRFKTNSFLAFTVRGRPLLINQSLSSWLRYRWHRAGA